MAYYIIPSPLLSSPSDSDNRGTSKRVAWGYGLVWDWGIFSPNHIILCSTSFIQVIPCAQRDALFCLPENGCITLRVCRSTTAPDESGKHPSTVTHTVSQSSLKNKNSSISVTHSFHSSIFSQKELIYSHTLCPSNQMYLQRPFYISRRHKVLIQKPSLKHQTASNSDVEAQCLGKTP